MLQAQILHYVPNMPYEVKVYSDLVKNDTIRFYKSEKIHISAQTLTQGDDQNTKSFTLWIRLFHRVW
jgi:hypothetical protein